MSQDTTGILRIRCPQDTTGILRIPRCPQDTAVSPGYRRYPQDTVSPGYRGILRMPPVSHDANLRFQTLSGFDTCTPPFQN